MERVSRESPSTRASSFSPRETYSVTYFLPLTKGPHRKKVRPFIYRGSHIRQLLMLQSPCVCRRSSARVPSCPLRHPPLPGVSRFRRIGSHLRRVRHLAGTMAAGARKQAASCSIQKHRRRPPASEAPLKLFGKQWFAVPNRLYCAFVRQNLCFPNRFAAIY